MGEPSPERCISQATQAFTDKDAYRSIQGLVQTRCSWAIYQVGSFRVRPAFHSDSSYSCSTVYRCGRSQSVSFNAAPFINYQTLEGKHGPHRAM